MAERNAFVALCELASKEKWCWKIGCTTCGCMPLRCSFIELARGKHPDDKSWPIRSSSDLRQEMPVFPGDLSEQQQLSFMKLVAEAEVPEIRKVATFPDWLGYLGMVLFCCAPLEGKRRILTQGLAPQLSELVHPRSRAAGYLSRVSREPALCLRIGDLEIVEEEMIDRDRYAEKERRESIDREGGRSG